MLSPYLGGKQAAVGDIHVTGRGGQSNTGMGCERIDVTGELSVVKRADEALRITLRRTPGGVEIVRQK